MAEDRAPEQAGNDSTELKRKLVKRMAFAGGMIALLLGALAVVDQLGEPEDDEAAPASPPRVAVPVPQKEIAQPLKTAPADAGAPADKAVAEAAAVPPPPEVAAQPVAQPPVPAGVSTAPTRVVSSRPIGPAPAAKGQASPVAVGAPVAPVAVPEGSATPDAPAKPAAATAAAPAVESAAMAAAAAKPPLPRLQRGYVLQAGVFANVKLAEELHAKLTLNGIPSTLEARVQVGPFRNRQEAEAARAKLKGLGVESLLVPPRAAPAGRP